MTDKELMQQALDALEGYARNCTCEGGGAPCDAAEALRARLTQPEPEELGEVIPADEEQLKRIAKLIEPEPVATLFGSLPVYDVPPAKPVAWVENLENARPHCVTDLKYCSVAQHERGEHLKYIPLYTAPPQREYTAWNIKYNREPLPSDNPHEVVAVAKREWQGLTNDEIMDACSAVWASHPIEVGQVVAAILKEKNGF